MSASRAVSLTGPTHALFAVALLLVVRATAVAAQNAQAENAYARLRALEQGLPNGADIDVALGTFDASSRTFVGLTSRREERQTGTKRVCESTDDGRGPVTKQVCNTVPVKQTIVLPPERIGRSRRVRLVVDVRNAGASPAVLRIDGQPLPATTAPAGAPAGTQRYAFTFAGDTTQLTWRLRWQLDAGGATTSDTLVVRRESFGVGAIRIPVIPVGILYDPPQDSLHRSSAKWKTTHSQAIAVTTTVASDRARTTPVPSSFTDVTSMQANLAMMAELLDAASAVMVRDASAALGSTSASSTAGSARSEAQSSMLEVTSSSEVTANTGKGPGQGDVIVYSRDVPIMWMCKTCEKQDQLKFAALGGGILTTVSASKLSSELAAARATGASRSAMLALDTASIVALLALDPFVTNPSPTLDPARFERVETVAILDAVRTESFEVTQEMAKHETVQRYQEWTQVDTASKLAAIGVGIPETQALHWSASAASARDRSTRAGSMLEVTFAPIGDGLLIDRYYDRLFGTFVFVPVPTEGEVSGTLAAAGSGADGAPGAVATSPNVRRLPGLGAPPAAAGREVVLSIGGREIRARVDASGAFRVPLPRGLAATEGTLRVQGTSLAPLRVMRTSVRTQLPPIRVP